MKKIVLMTVLAVSLLGCRKDCPEKPEQGCICKEDYNPVCSCEGVTYSNACEAECKGVTCYKKGKCNN